MNFVIIKRNVGTHHAKNPPTPEQAAEAMEDVGGTNVLIPEQEQGQTKIEFDPPEEGHYQTDYPRALADVVENNSRPTSWDFQWG